MAEKKIIISVEVSSEKAKQTIESTAKSVDRLAKAEKELAFQQSEKGKKLAEVNEKTRKQKELNKEVAQSNLGLKKSIDPVIEAKKKLAQLQSPEAIELEKVNQQLKIQKDLNVAAAKSDLGLTDSKSKLNKEISKEEQLTEKLNYELSDEAKRVAILNENLKIARQRNAEYAQSQINLTQKNDGLNKTIATGTKGLQQNRAQSGLNNAILIELGRTASDAQYGFQGMANNIGRIVELGQEFTRTGGGGLKNSLLTLGKSILGSGGILIGIQLLISFLPTLQKKFKGMKKDTDDLSKANKELTRTYDELLASAKENRDITEDATDAFEGANEALVKYGRLYDENSKAVGRGKTRQDEYNKAVNEAIDTFSKYGIEVDKTRLTDKEYLDSLKSQTDELEKRAQEITDLRSELEVRRTLGEISPVEEAQKELDIFIKTQELMGVEEEKYLNSTQYKVLVAKRTKAENEARLAVLREEFAEQYQQELEMKEVIKRMVAESQDEEVPIFGDEEALDMSLSQYSDFISKYIDRTLEGINEQEQRAIQELNDFRIDALLSEEEYQESLTAIKDFYANKRMKTQKTEQDFTRDALKANLDALANFFQNSAELDNKNKALAKAAIIAQAASAGLGIWDTWWNKDKTPMFGKAIYSTIGTAVSFAALAASTVSALRSVDSGTPMTSSAGGGAQIQAPDFNVVGASGQSQLAQTIAGAEAQPVRAFVVGKDISTQQELDRNITNTASFG